MQKKTFSVLLTLFMLTSIFYLGKQAMSLMTLRQEVKKLKQTGSNRAYLHNNALKIIPLKNKIASSIFFSAQANGLQVRSAAIAKGDNNSFIIEATLVGELTQLIQFAKEFSHWCFPLNIDQAVLKKEHDQLEMKIQLTAFGFCLQAPEKYQLRVNEAGYRDPFVNVITNDRVKHRESLQRFSIDQIKFVGYLQYPRQKIAMVMLPNGDVAEVIVGDRLGMERAQIISIKEDGLAARLNGKNVELIGRI